MDPDPSILLPNQTFSFSLQQLGLTKKHCVLIEWRTKMCPEISSQVKVKLFVLLLHLYSSGCQTGSSMDAWINGQLASVTNESSSFQVEIH